MKIAKCISSIVVHKVNAGLGLLRTHPIREHSIICALHGFIWNFFFIDVQNYGVVKLGLREVFLSIIKYYNKPCCLLFCTLRVHCIM